MIAPFETLTAIPDELQAAEAAPLLCAGITTYNALRNSGIRPGDTVAVLGIGGLGHLGVQFAAKMGCRTIAIARGADKGPLARKLGAHHHLDSTNQDVAAELNKLGAVRAFVETVSARALTRFMSILIGLSIATHTRHPAGQGERHRRLRPASSSECSRC
jgi:D-arabinose 1-dehydrogenase-like Zn-dependent alcohol dehydrogenase